MTWPADKLSVIAQQCSLTGYAAPSVADDQSDEWIVCSAAYEFAIEYMYEKYGWKQITKMVTLQSTGTAPSDPMWDTAYAKPSDLIHLIFVRLDDRVCDYGILNNQIVLNALGTVPGFTVGDSSSTPGVVTIKYVSSDPDGDQSDAAQKMTRTFMTALGLFVRAGIYRGLRRDAATADREEQKAMLMVQEAATRSDQEAPKRSFFNFRLRTTRNVRRPWPRIPAGWSGTNSPGGS